MAAIPVQISGELYDLFGKRSTRVVLMGDLSLTGLGVGGGPIIPPGGGQPPDPNAPHPSHPIAKPGDPWWGGDLRPEHPIVLPPIPVDPPISGEGKPPEGGKPPPPGGGWGYVPGWGWAFFPGPTQPGPKEAAPKK